MSAVLEIEDLSVSFGDKRTRTQVLRDVSLSVQPGEILGVVGESGSGKSVTSLAAMGLLGPAGRFDRGSIRLSGRELTGLHAQQMRELRGPGMAMIFQEPATSLNPVRRIGDQIVEAMTEHGTAPAPARKHAVDLLNRVGIPAAEARMRDYPHQLSGGMKQRIMIAMALACDPKVLIADEPTTALDVTIQAQILNLILELRDTTGMAVLLITHDMGVVSRYVDRVAVMYAGEIVETAPVDRLFSAPGHPYASMLMRAIPSARRRQADLPVIAGTTPPPHRLPEGCRFAPRCPLAIDACRAAPPPLAPIGTDHLSRCIRTDQVAQMVEVAT